MLVKFHEYLHPLIKFKTSVVDQDFLLLGLKFGYLKVNCKYKWINKRACPKGTIDFLTIPSGCEKHQMSYSMVGVEKHESMFPIVSFLAC
jgi:hypothetical protein